MLVITTKEQKVLKRFLENNLENKISALEPTKESFFFLWLKKSANVLPSHFEKRKKGVREGGGQKITFSSQGFH